jgi:hypothetical protein
MKWHAYLGEVFARRGVDGSIGGVQKGTGGTGLTGALAEELAGDVFCV